MTGEGLRPCGSRDVAVSEARLTDIIFAGQETLNDDLNSKRGLLISTIKLP